MVALDAIQQASPFTRGYGEEGEEPLRDFRIGELFCGAGGLALGASKARYRGLRLKHVWANDSDYDACETFKKNFDGADKYVINEDVGAFSERFKYLPQIDGLIFGSPCNDFSLMGKRKGMVGQYGQLFYCGIHALKHFKPVFFLAENVVGLKSSNDRKDIEDINDWFKMANYEVHSITALFEYYKVPQTRHRQIFIGFRKDYDIKNFTMPEQYGESEIITCKDALESKIIGRNVSNHDLKNKTTDRVRKRLEFIKPGENAFNADIPKEHQLNLNSGANFSNIYRRLDPNKPAYTVTASGGGGTYGYHWSEPRALTNRERARLQTFPDDFVFTGKIGSVRRQIGMSVPPVGIEFFFNSILKVLHSNNIHPGSIRND